MEDKINDMKLFAAVLLGVLSVGCGKRADYEANLALLCNAKGEGRKVSLNDVMSDLN